MRHGFTAKNDRARNWRRLTCDAHCVVRVIYSFVSEQLGCSTTSKHASLNISAVAKACSLCLSGGRGSDPSRTVIGPSRAGPAGRAGGRASPRALRGYGPSIAEPRRAGGQAAHLPLETGQVISRSSVETIRNKLTRLGVSLAVWSSRPRRPRDESDAAAAAVPRLPASLCPSNHYASSCLPRRRSAPVWDWMTPASCLASCSSDTDTELSREPSERRHDSFALYVTADVASRCDSFRIRFGISICFGTKRAV